MRGVVYALILLISVISASASYTPVADVIFEFKGATCDSNGTIKINLSHVGRNLKFSEVNFTIENEEFEKQNLIGDWYQGDWKTTENYTGTDFSSSARFVYQSLPKIYTEGKYIIKMTWPSTSHYYDRLSYAVDCPGIPCKTNDDCVSQQACDNTCVWLQCPEGMYASGHACLKKCEDYSECTDDYYIDNQCVHIEREECKEKSVETEKEIGLFWKFWNWLTGN